MTTGQLAHSEPAAPVPMPIAQPKKRKGGLGNALLVVAALVAVGGIAFAGGRMTASATATGAGQAVAQAPSGSFAPGGAAMGGSMTMSGTVTAIDGTAMTITTSGGQTVTVDVSSSTYHAQAAGSAADLAAGDTVQVTVAGRGVAPSASGAPAASAGTSVATVTATDVMITSR